MRISRPNQLKVISKANGFLVFVIMLLSFFSTNRAFAQEITKINKVFFESNSLNINFSGTKPKVKQFALKSSKQGFSRLVFDFQDSQITNENISGSPNVQQLQTRISQFSKDPFVVRIVFEGPKQIINKVSISKDSKKISFGSIETTASHKQNTENTKPPEYRLSTISKVDFDNNQLIVKGNYGLKKKVFNLNNKDKKMLVVDLKKANLVSTKLAKAFSTHSTEKIRIAQFEPGTVRIVIEGPESDQWQFQLEDRDTQLIAFKGKAAVHSTKISSGTTNSISANNLSIKNGNPAKISILNLTKSKIKYKYFQLNSPERLVLDLYNWKEDPNKLIPKEALSSTIIGVRSGRPSKDKSVARLVFDLSEKNLDVKDTVSSDQRTLTLTLSPKSAKASSKFAVKRKNAKVVIDAGHGGYDSGAHYHGTEEKILSLEITKKIEQILKTRNVEVVQTRKDDRFISLDERVALTKKAKPDLFVSVHCNALESSSRIYGIETYYFTDQSRQLAKTLHKSLVNKTKAPDRRVRKARFVVIRETSIPSVLLEVGFLSNSSERNKLKSNSYQNKVAEAIADGITEYLNSLK